MTDLNHDLEKAVTSNDFREIGSSGLVQYGGEVKEDFLRALQGKSGYANYTQMADNDPVIGACLHAIEMMIRGVDWTVEPVDTEDQKAVEVAEFCAGCLNDMSQTWADTLSNIMSMLVYGFSFHEIVYKRRKGRTGKSDTNSKYDDRLAQTGDQEPEHGVQVGSGQERWNQRHVPARRLRWHGFFHGVHSD